ncbi:MAG: AMP-binding protein [Pseudonocardiaceae bacterium]
MDQHKRADHRDTLADIPGGRSVRSRERAVAALGTALATLGVRPEEQVLILMPAGLGFADAIVGTIRQGAVPLPMSPWTWTSELLMTATESGSRLAVVSAERISALANLRTLREMSVCGEQGHWATVLSLDLNPAGGIHRLRQGFTLTMET